MLSLRECIDALIRCACGDGNLLLNVGPMPTGEIEPRQAERLNEIGDWLKKHGKSVYATRGGPFRPGTWGGSTHRDKTIYVHILEFGGREVLDLPPCKQRVVSSSLLSGGQVTVEQTESRTRITVPARFQQKLNTVVELLVANPVAAKDIEAAKSP
jgi:alpha-L-fucosidase